jgi:type IX secretion system PorP/SprF family membrane protein
MMDKKNVDRLVTSKHDNIRIVYFPLIVLMFLSSFRAVGQDPYFVCFQRALLSSNPAFTGSSGYLRVQTAASYLWPGIGGSFSTFGSVDTYVGKGSSLGLSWSYQNDKPAFKKQFYGINYSNRFSLFKKKKLVVQPGCRISYTQLSTDWASLNYGYNIDSVKGFEKPPYTQGGLTRKSSLDLDLGLVVYTNNFFVGLSLSHITQPQEGLLCGPLKLQSRLGIQGAYQFKLSKEIVVIPSIQCQRQTDYLFASVGGSFKYKKWIMGSAFSSNKSISINCGWQNDRIKLGLSHSIFFGKYMYARTYGAYELNFSWLFLDQNQDRIFISPIGF